MSTDDNKTAYRTQIIVAVISVIGVLGAAAIARWGGPSNSGAKMEPARVIPSIIPVPIQPNVSISGQWIDNWGTQYSVTHTGDRFQFTASGSSCRGRFSSQGSGTVTGRLFELSYRTAYSTGKCTGTVSSTGNQLTSNCTDSVCGAFQAHLAQR
jgi:hypothetical protein